jgi:hypothetical protein
MIPTRANDCFERFELEVPEFARAFLTERDYIMAEAIRCESSKGASQPSCCGGS